VCFFSSEGHYADLSSKGFFNDLTNFFSSGPIVAMVWEGEDVIATGRRMLGATKPKDSAPGTIRGDFAVNSQWDAC
jgi:nucleoside-diphosphate kinase